MISIVVQSARQEYKESFTFDDRLPKPGKENPKNRIDHGNQQTLKAVKAKMKEEPCSKLSDQY